MTTRSANNNDIPAIVKLLKLSLGESLLPKSEAYWNWKHIDNPFGQSLVLVAEENGEIIGVRAFMRWDWIRGGSLSRGGGELSNNLTTNQITTPRLTDSPTHQLTNSPNPQKIHALRAVDTAIHPNYQGKGIFKKLTLALVKECKEQEFYLIFNSPNKQSKPGYIKMGWKEMGRLPIKIGISLKSKNWKKIRTCPNVLPAHRSDMLLKNIDSLNEFQAGVHHWITAITKEYILWRYVSVPVSDYGFIFNFQTETPYLIIFRNKVTSGRAELRLVEVLFNRQDKNSIAMVRQEVYSLYSDYQPAIISMAAHLPLAIIPTFLKLKVDKGPLVTKRILAWEKSNYDAWNFKTWSPQLGAMELF